MSSSDAEKVDCDGGSAFKMMLATLDRMKKSGQGQGKQLDVIEEGIKNYLQDCTICKRQGENASSCHNMAMTKLFRHMPFIYQSVYPWANYDWDYSNFIDNNYSAQATGSSSTGDMFRNFGIFFKFLNAYLFDPNPDPRSVAGGMDQYSDYPVYGCQGNNRKQCEATTRVRNRNAPSQPYPDAFFNQSSIGGEHASSYFIRVGHCPRPDVKTQKACLDAKYDWTATKNPKTPDDGSCFQPRYAYLDNSPGLDISPIPGTSLKIKGYFPSLTNDFLSLTPEKLVLAMTGNSVSGHLKVQPCPKVAESFIGRRDPRPPYSEETLRDNDLILSIIAKVFGIGIGIVVSVAVLYYVIQRYLM